MEEPTNPHPLSPARDPPGWSYQIDQTLDLFNKKKNTKEIFY